MGSDPAPETRRKARSAPAKQAGRKQTRAPRKARPKPAPESPRVPRAGTVALVGRPNVGKSTLLNALLGARLAITSRHPQTTRDRIAGILTTDDTQYVLFDTPGLHAPRNRLGQRMNELARGAVADADAIMVVTDVGPKTPPEVDPRDREVLATIPSNKPVVLVINKIDRVTPKERLFEVLAAYGAAREFEAIVPISALKKNGIERVLEAVRPLLPEGDPLYPDDELSDRPVRFFVAELLREQVLARTRQEVPHGVAVTVDAFEEPAAASKRPVRITLTIHVAKDSHKGIVIGQGGKMLAAIGTAARERAEALLDQRVHLDVRVKATPGWFDDAARLVDLGYGEEDQ